MGNMVDSDDPGKIPHKAAFHLSLHCVHRQNRFSEKEMQYFLKLLKNTP